MIQICAWCEQEGKREILGMPSSGKDERESHGICSDHILRLRQSYNHSRRHPSVSSSSFSLSFLALPGRMAHAAKDMLLSGSILSGRLHASLTTGISACLNGLFQQSRRLLSY